MLTYHKICLANSPTYGLYSFGMMSKEPSDWEHTGDNWRIVLYEYDGWLEFKGRRLYHKPGSVITLPPRSHFRQDRYGEDLLVVFANFRLIDAETDWMAMPILSELESDYHHIKKDWIRAIVRLNLSTGPAKSYLHSLLWRIAEPLTKYSRHPAVDAAEDMMISHLDKELTLSMVAEEAEISPNQLIRLFRQEHGTTPMGFLRTRRAEEAHRLLTTTDLPIKQIAQKVGISSLQYFNRFLHEHYGFGPRQIRESGESASTWLR